MLYRIRGALLEHKNKCVFDIFADIDEVLESFFDGEMDEITVKLING